MTTHNKLNITLKKNRVKLKKAKIAIIGAGNIGHLLFKYIFDHKTTIPFFVDTRITTNKFHSFSYTNSYVTKTTSSNIALNTNRYNTVIQNIKSITDANAIIISTKSFQVPIICSLISSTIDPRVPIIIATNGICALEVHKYLPYNPIYALSTTHGVASENKTYTHIDIMHLGKGQFSLGSISNPIKTHSCSSIINKLQNSLDIPHLSKNITQILLKKLVVNSIINPLTALNLCCNGALKEHTSKIQNIIKELKPIYHDLGLELSEEELFDIVNNVIESTALNTSSMAQDFMQRRPSEIDDILGILIERAKNMHKVLPFTQYLYYTLKNKESQI